MALRVERRSSSAGVRRHLARRSVAATLAERPLEQGSPLICWVARQINEARETRSEVEASHLA
jgi:hypothetical protein